MAKTPREVLDAVDRRYKALKKAWLDDAEEVVDIYEAEEDECVPFNILYSNTETILPALYNSTPRPEVTRRHTQLGREKTLDSVVAQVAERTLEYAADSNSGEYETFDSAVRGAVLNALVPGQGVVRVRYKEEDAYQEICYDRVAYDRFVWGYARKWSDVPWIAFGHDLNKADFEKTFPEFVRKEVYQAFKWDELGEDEEEEARRREENGTRKEPTLLVWEVWTASTKQIQFVCSTFSEDFLKEEPYPFALTARFPTPEPLKFALRNDNLTPVPPYKFYKKQAEELNEVTRRLHIVLKAIKVRGGYNGALTELATILDSDDTALIPVENASLVAEAGGFDKHIWLMPLQELVNVAQVLYEAQNAAKQTIYEIMGIGDILRGASFASETARAQEIKNQWGSLRIKRAQKDVMNFCRDLFRITLEFAANLYTPATFAQVTKVPLLTEGQKRLMAMSVGQQPDSVPPEIQARMTLPSWEEVLSVLQNQFERTYRLDIETNSTVDLEATEDKAQIAEFMNAWGQMMSGFQPLIQSGAMPFEAVKLVMGEIFRRFRFARRVEQAFDLLQNPPPPEEPKLIKAQYDAEMAKIQAEAKRQIGEMQETVIEMTGELERLRVENTKLKAEQGLKDQQVKVASAMEKNAIQSDYRGKVELLKGEMSKMQDQQLLKEVQRMLEQSKQDLANTIAGFKTELGATQKVMSVKEQTAAAPIRKVEDALQALAQNQTAMMQAIEKVAALAGAERESEIFIGPDGKKRSRSRVVIQ